MDSADAKSRRKKPLPWWQENIGKSIALTFAAYLLVLALAHYLPTASWLTAAHGLGINQLGPLGDSFGPLTAIFAALAAFGAWRSYGAQRQQLNDEKNRHRGTRFDETFFRLLDHYGRELARVQARVQKTGTEPLRGADVIEDAKDRAKERLKNRVSTSPIDAVRDVLEQKDFRPLRLLRDQMIASTRWLKRQHKGVYVEIRGALLVAKLSDVELWFWYLAIQSTKDADLIRFASRLGIEAKRALAEASE